jgi:copper homeostasis protein
MEIEICANSYQSAFNAQNAGADRIELCSELAVGGITPSYGLLKEVLSKLSIPVYVLIRPRSGDFCYSNDDFEIIKQDINLCKKLQCDGIVSGVLHQDMTIDIQRTKELIALAEPLPFTFHRAFDSVPNPLQAVQQLDEMGVERILTSGQQSNAIDGLPLLSKLQENFSGIIIPASGINPKNIKQFADGTFKEIHFSASSQEKRMTTNFLPLNSAKHFDETYQAYTDQTITKQMISLIHE